MNNANKPTAKDAITTAINALNTQNLPVIIETLTDHGQRFAARIESGPILGVQFHPEKSQDAGEDLLRNFLYL